MFSRNFYKSPEDNTFPILKSGLGWYSSLEKWYKSSEYLTNRVTKCIQEKCIWEIEHAPYDIGILLSCRVPISYTMCKKAVKKNWTIIKHIQIERLLQYIDNSYERKLLEELANIAVSQNGNALQYIPEKYRTYSVCRKAITSKPSMIRYVPEEHRTQELIINLVNKTGTGIIYLKDSERTPEIMQIARGKWKNVDKYLLRSAPI